MDSGSTWAIASSSPSIRIFTATVFRCGAGGACGGDHALPKAPSIVIGVIATWGVG